VTPNETRIQNSRDSQLHVTYGRVKRVTSRLVSVCDPLPGLEHPTRPTVSWGGRPVLLWRGDFHHIPDLRALSRMDHADNFCIESRFTMDALQVMAVLVNIERVAGRVDPIAIRAMAVEAQEGVLRLQQQLMAVLADNGSLREQLEVCTQLSRLLPASA
jgi:hypothetical protein